MSHTHLHTPAWTCALAVLLIPWSISRAATQIEEHHPASPRGSVDIVNVAGSIDVQGWDKAEVEVTGTAGNNVERVEVGGDADRTSVHVILQRGNWSSGREGEARLVIHVPGGSSITTSLISADLKITGVRGDVKLQSVSGNINGELGGDVRASGVSGNLVLTAIAAKSIEAKTVSGSIVLSGGDADTEVSTVSGDAKLTLKTPVRARLQSVSGTLAANFALGTDAKVEAETVSGDIKLEFAGIPSGDFDIESFSGAINNCFGPSPVKAKYGPGTRLTFKTGESQAHVRLETKSGDVRMCNKG